MPRRINSINYQLVSSHGLQMQSNFDRKYSASLQRIAFVVLRLTLHFFMILPTLSNNWGTIFLCIPFKQMSCTRKLKQDGEKCKDSVECREGFYCKRNEIENQVVRTCEKRPPRAEGETCMKDVDCQSDHCQLWNPETCKKLFGDGVDCKVRRGICANQYLDSGNNISRLQDFY